MPNAVTPNAVAIGGEILVNTIAAGNQTIPAVTGLADGGFVVTWTDASRSPDDPSTLAIRAQVFNADGSKAGSEFLVPTTTPGAQDQPAITTLADGRFIIAWQDASRGPGDNSGDAVRAQIFHADGTKSGSEFIVPATTSSHQDQPAIAGLPGGGFVAAWSDFSGVGDASPSGIRAQIFAADGSRAGGEFEVNTTIANSQDMAALAAFADGKFVAVWQDGSDSAGDTSVEAVRGQVFNADGSKSGNEFLVNTTTNGGQFTPTVTTLADGHFVVAWIDAGLNAPDVDGYAVRAQVFNHDGSKSGSEFLVNTTTAHNQYQPSLTALPDGRFVAVFTDDSGVGGDSSTGVHAQVFYADGSRSGAEFVVNATTASTQWQPTVSALAQGGFVVAWEDLSATGGDTSGNAIRAQRFDFRAPPVISSDGGGDAATKSIAENTSAVTTVTASDADSSSLTYSIAGGTDAARFAIDPVTGVLSFLSAPDFENSTAAGANNAYVVTVRVSDGSQHDDQAITVNVTNVNEAPIIVSNGGAVSATFSLPEHTTAVTTVAAVDPDAGDTVGFSIAGGPDDVFFQINPTTGVLSFRTAPDFAVPADEDHDNTYAVTVRASDGRLSDDQGIVVHVTEVNRAPTIVSNGGGATATVSAPEDFKAVTMVAATDPNAGDTVHYSIAGGVDAALFQIDDATGALSFKAAPDFEASDDADHDNHYEVTVRASDGTLYDDQAVTVAVTNVNETPIFDNGGVTLLTTPENLTGVATMSATDPDGDALTYSIAGGNDAALFHIDPTSGELFFNQAPDFEAPADADHDNGYRVTVRVSDGALHDDDSFIVEVTDVAEAAPPARFGAEFLVNTTTLSHQNFAAIAGFPNGGFIATWIDSSRSNDDLQGDAIRAQVFNADATKAGDELLVNTTTRGNQDYPGIATLSDGRFVVTWTDYYIQNSNASDVRAQIFAHDGTKAGAEFVVNSLAGDQAYPVVAGLDDGRFVVAWNGLGGNGVDPDSTGLRFRLYDSDGAGSSPEFRVDPDATSSPFHVVVTALTNGHFALSWMDSGHGDSQNGGIHAQVFDAQGTSLGDAFVVNTTTAGDQNFPSITGLADGGFVVAWTDLSRTTGDTDGAAVRAQVFDASGEKSGSEFVVNTTTHEDQSLPKLTALPDGRFVATWSDDSNTGGDTSNGAVRAQVFNHDGTRSGAEFLVNSITEGSQSGPVITALADGRFVAAWQDLSGTLSDTSGFAVHAQVFDPREAPVHLVGTPLDDDFVGTRFDDTFAGGGGNDRFDGSAGDDTALFAGDRDQYTLQILSDGRISVSGPDGVDTLANTEHLRFADMTLDTATIGNGPVMVSLTGTPGDDSFAALPGNERIDALGGTDTVSFDFALTDAVVSYAGNQVIIDGPASHTVLTGFERFVFTDGTVDNADGDPLVDDLFYYSHNHDVWNAHADADAHYHQSGWHEGRDPNAFFSTATYLAINPDVNAAGIDPLIHFDQAGWKEGRLPSLGFDPRAYLAANPDVAAAGADPLAHFLESGAGEGRQPIAPIAWVTADGFDYVYYLNHNPDVAAAHVDPYQHYMQTGWHEGRNPNAYFDTDGYLEHNPDVAAAGVNPLTHYAQTGWLEGRDPSPAFDTHDYLAAYPDVAAAGVNPLEHFLQSGIHEGRMAFADGLCH